MMRGAIHFFLALGLGQSLLLPDPAKTRAAPQYIAVTTTVSAPAVAPGSTATLFLDVTPNPRIHVYAPGNKDYLPIGLTLDPPAGVTPGPIAFQKAGTITFAGEVVSVYSRRFRLRQEIALGPDVTPGSTLTVRGVVDYQACDDKICFKPATLPVTWTLSVR